MSFDPATWPNGPDCAYSDPPAWVTSTIDWLARDAGHSIRPLVLWAGESEDTDGLNGMAASPGEDVVFPNGMVWLNSHDFTLHTILHEMAHWLCPIDEGHGPLFYRTALPLFLRYGVSFDDWGYREDWVEAEYQGVDLESMWGELGGEV